MTLIFPKRFFLCLVLSCCFYQGCSDRATTSDNLPDHSLLENEFRVIGPGGGGGVFKPVISPFNNRIVMVSCDMTGAYISHDGGDHWKMKNLWNVPNDYIFDPSDSNVIYLATRGFSHSEDRGSGISLLLRSRDKGNQWKIIYPDVSNVKKKITRLQSFSLKTSQIIPDAVDGNIERIAVDPSDNRHLYLGLAPMTSYMASGTMNRDSSVLITSADKGSTWNIRARFAGKTIKAIIPGINFGNRDHVIVITGNSFITIDESSGKVTESPLPVPGIIAAAGGITETGYVIYIQSKFIPGGKKGGMYVTEDLGVSWEQINTGLTEKLPEGKVPSFNEGLAVCETQPRIAYISMTYPESDENGSAKSIYSIFKTTDMGLHWKPVLLSSSRDGYITKNFSGSWMEKSYDPGWGGSPINLGVAPGNPDICYAGDAGRCYKTVDGGLTWHQLYSHNQPDRTYSSGGLDVTTCYGVHFDPFDTGHLFICYTDIGLFHSFNNSESWEHSATGIPGRWLNTCYDLAFDPSIKNKIWSAWANAHDLPRDKMFGDYGFSHYAGGVALSEDGGKTWHPAVDGLPENAICTNILLDPDSPDGNRTLWVSVFNQGIYRSTDDGRHWTGMNTGLGKNLFAWEIRRNSTGRLFVLFARGKQKGITIDGAVYYSDDKAETWKPINLPDSVNGPHDLMLDPGDPEIMYVSCWPRTMNGTDKKGGIIKTTDGGLTWSQVFDERVRVNSAGMDPEHSNIIYINTFQNAAYRSDDAGENWTRLNGYRFKWGQRVIPDIHHPDMLFLTTYGGSVFYGPAKGIRNAGDDITNMPDGWW